jgi:hypothetical protein
MKTVSGTSNWDRSGEDALATSDGKIRGGRAPGGNQTDGRDYPEDLSEVMDFSSCDLRTTIRLIVLSGECRRVDVQRGSKRGAIFINAGEIYRVVTNDTRGDEAFFEILAWDKTVHRDCWECSPTDANVRVPTNVLLEVMKQMAPAT